MEYIPLADRRHDDGRTLNARPCLAHLCGVHRQGEGELHHVVIRQARVKDKLKRILEGQGGAAIGALHSHSWVSELWDVGVIGGETVVLSERHVRRCDNPQDAWVTFCGRLFTVVQYGGYFYCFPANIIRMLRYTSLTHVPIHAHMPVWVLIATYGVLFEFGRFMSTKKVRCGAKFEIFEH